MHYVKAIRMGINNQHSGNYNEISQLYVNEHWLGKGCLYDYLKSNPNSIAVNISPYPRLIPKMSKNGEKFVASEPDAVKDDNLMNLPKK